MSDKVQAENEGDINLVELTKLIWSRRFFLTKITLAFFSLGVLIALTSRTEYNAYCRLLPESQEGSIPDLGGLGGLAGLAGFNLSDLGSNGSLSPEMYPEIVNSTPFLVKLINEKVYFEKRDTSISSYDYFNELESSSFFELIGEYTIGMAAKFRSKEDELKNYNMTRFSKEDWRIIEDFAKRLIVSVDPKSGVINVEAEMPDPVAAAEIATILVGDLTRRIIDYKIGKVEINLLFIEERFKDAKKEYNEKQKQLARFTDQNRNVSNSIVQTEFERLQNELDISFEVYKGLATQLEQAKIKVKEETPVFTVLEPVRVPEEKSKPKRTLIVIAFSIVGFILGSGIILLQNIKFKF